MDNRMDLHEKGNDQSLIEKIVDAIIPRYQEEGGGADNFLDLLFK